MILLLLGVLLGASARVRLLGAGWRLMLPAAS